jgi:glycosyltransferase involved in cell wall biosynthesis
MKKILFLYTELAGYFEACIRELNTKDVEIHIVRWPVNNEAPFKFSFPGDVKIYDRNKFDNKELLELATKINPDLIISSGWVDKGYLKVCKTFNGKVPVVLTMDNQWSGSLKQQIAKLVAPFTLLHTFSHAWVPGQPQKEYALRLGFNPDRIETGFYSADTLHFSKIADKRFENKFINKRFLYIGRYIPQKGIDKLFSAFLELAKEGYDQWELWCMGTGDLYDERPVHEKIKHFGFVQPSEMEKYLEQAGVFVLPSDFEPWGVVVHEMAAAGFPIIVSSAVGSVSGFVDDGVNGFVFPKGDKRELKASMKKVMELNEKELMTMAKESYKRGISWNPEKWAEKVMRIMGSGDKV